MVDSPEANLAHARGLVLRAIQKSARIICLPELYRSLYFPQKKKHDVQKYLESIPGPSVAMFAPIAKKHKVVIIAPIFEKTKNGRTYNSAVVINEKGTVLPAYRKLHIPHDPGFYEQDYFEKGNMGYRVYHTSYATFAVLICFDQWFPEAARMARLAGAEIIFYPTAIGNLIGYIPPEGNWQNAWETIQRSHAIANSVAVAAVNRVGVEGKTKFWGGSFVADAVGNVIRRANNKETVLVETVDLGLNSYVSDGWGFLRNRRPDTYRLSVKKRI